MVPNDLGETEVLTPAYALFAAGDSGPLLGTWDIEDCFRRRWHHAQLMSGQFWKWMKEYLPTLTRRQKKIWCQPQLKVGDIVLVIDIHTPHNQWPLARVTKVISSDDGLVHRVKLQSSKGSLSRAPVHLCLLEGV